MFQLHRKLIAFLALFPTISGSYSGWSAPTTAKLDLANSRPVSTGERTPAVGLLFRYTDSATRVERIKSCVGVRVSPTQILTAAACISAGGDNPAELTTILAGNGYRSSRQPQVLEIRQHPGYKAADRDMSPYNLAVIRFEFFPSDLDDLVEVAGINQQRLNIGDSLRAYGAGCGKLKANENCVLRYLKTFSTTLGKFEDDSRTQKFFTIAEGKDEIMDGSLGSPVLNVNGAVVGLASSLQAKGRHVTYINVNDSKILDLIHTSNRPAQVVQPGAFDFRLLENDAASFMAVGSFPTVEIGSTLAGFDLSIYLNGMPIENKSLKRNGSLYTIPNALQEGRNTLLLVALDRDGKIMFEGELQIYAGSRTIRLSLPEVKNTKESRMRADLIVDRKTGAHGRGQFEGNALVFKNVPLLPTIARVEFPDQGLSYTEFLDEKATERTLSGGRLRPVTSHENLDFSNSVSGWNSKGDPKSIRVIKGKDLKKELKNSP